jgi:hypothetical protein
MGNDTLSLLASAAVGACRRSLKQLNGKGISVGENEWEMRSPPPGSVQLVCVAPHAIATDAL